MSGRRYQVDDMSGRWDVRAWDVKRWDSLNDISVEGISVYDM